MKKNVRSVIIKVLIVVVVWALFAGLNRVFMPVWTNEMALNQLDLTSQSYTTFAAWQVMIGWVTAVLSLISVAIFVPNVIAFVKYKRSEKKLNEEV